MNFNMTIGEIMNQDLITVRANTKLSDFKKSYESRGIHHILVEDEHAKVLGVISSEDVLKVNTFFLEPKLEAKHIMTENPVALNIDDEVGKALDIFLENRFRCIPIKNKDNVLVGIVTPYDLLIQLGKDRQTNSN